MDAADAKRTIKKAAAALLVKKDAAAERVQRLQARRDEFATGLQQAQALADSAQIEQMQASLRDAEEHLDLEQQVLAKIETDLQDTLRDMDALPGLQSQGERAALQAKVSALSASDPFAVSAEDRALENVRGAISELDAQVKLQAELAGEAEPTLSRAEAKQAEEDAIRAQLAALKAKKNQQAVETPAGPASEGDTPAPKKRSKRTL